MSGLFGYLNPHLAESPEHVAHRMGHALCHLQHHRVEYAAPNRYVAVGRHTIDILNRAPQPICSKDGQVWLWLCGEFYLQDQRRADLPPGTDDAALALDIYLSQQVEGLLRLDGAFTLAIWDARTAELLLVNDRFGLYPHYYAHTGGVFAFAPEIKSVLVGPGIPRQLSDVALAEYVRFQQMLGDHTWFEDVHVLPAATLLRYRPADAQLTLHRYWHLSEIVENTRLGFAEAAEETSRLFARAVRLRQQGAQRVGVYLSGGLDGRMILGFLDRQAPVTTITFGQPGCRDVVYAAEIARRAGSNHHWFPLTDGSWVQKVAPLHLALTEGQHSWMHAHGLSTLAEARTLVDVNLSGWEGEMTLGGLLIGDDYVQDNYYRHPPSEADFIQRMYDVFCQKLTWPGLTEAEAHALFSGRGAAHLRTLAFDSLSDEIARTRFYPANRRADYVLIEQHVRRSLQQQVVFARSSIEVRCPFFDQDLLAWVFALPLAIHTNPQLRRTILTRQMPRLATVPYEKDDRLPHSSLYLRQAHSLVQRAKNLANRVVYPIFPQRTRLYADYEQYLRTDLRGWAEGILFDRRTLDRGLFDPAAVRALWERHLSGRELWTIGKIAPLITIELVLRTFYDGDSIELMATTATTSHHTLPCQYTTS
jgi:asparagine synthase (glutamine-hydrolysing)